MTINHEHKLPELSVIETAELNSMRAALVENARQINNLRAHTAALRNQTDDARTQWAKADGEVSDLRLENASLKATVNQLRINTLSDEDAALLGVKKPFELEREIAALQRKLDFAREDAAKHSDRANRIQGMLNIQTEGRNNWQQRARRAEGSVVDLERKLVETRARISNAELRSTQNHNAWLDEQLRGPGLALPNGRYMMQSGVGDLLTIKRDS